jgi:predicted deacylase
MLSHICRQDRFYDFYGMQHNLEEPLQSDRQQYDRKLGSYIGSGGPTIMILGGLHGNEPAGIQAFQRVLQTLHTRKLRFFGQIHGFSGNITALNAGERYIHEDMNRYWYRYMHRRNSTIDNSIPEDNQREELIEAISSTMQEAQTPVVFFDLHSTSAPSLPFVSINDSLHTRGLVKGLPVPVILGLQEQIEGTLNGLLNDMGLPAVLFEAGQHDDPHTVDIHEAFIWYMLYRLGCIKRNAVKSLNRYRDILKNASKERKGFYEITFRHAIEPDDEFRMNPGYNGFEPVRKNMAVAKDRHGDITAPHSDLMFMPLYQSKGSDGYFLIKKVRRIWIAVSKWLRKKHIDNYLHWLPGVTELEHEKGTFRVDESIAFAFALQVFHLLGYRKERIIEDQLYVSRIRYDDHPPSKETFFANLKRFMSGKE